MKKIYLLCLLFLFTNKAFSQEYDSDSDFDRVSIGLHFSPVFGKIKNDVMHKSDARSNYSFGLMTDFYFHKRYAIHTGLDFAGYGGKSKDATTGQDVTYKTNYLDVPFALKMRSNPLFAANMRMYGLFGCTTGFNLSAKKTAADITSDIENANFIRMGMLIGGGLEFPLGRDTRIVAGVSYNYGFTDIIDDAGNATSSYVSMNFGLFF